MSRPFQPPSTSQEAIEQLRNLHNKLNELDSIQQLTSASSTADIISTVNKVLTGIQAITKASTPARRG